MKSWPTKNLGEFVEEQTTRLREETATIYSVTNDQGFVRSLELFDKQVFSADIGNYKRVAFHDIAYNPSRINVGSVAMLEDANGGAVSPMYTIVRCNSKLSPRYLLHFLKSDIGQHQIRHRCEGAVRFQLKFRDLCAIPVPVPPLHQQGRIVKLLDDADVLRKLRSIADQRTADLIPALFHEMFGNPLSTVGTWPAHELRELGKVVTGSTPPSAKEGMFGGNIPFITPGDLESNTRNTMRYLTDSGAAEVRIVRSGSTMVCCIGATIGKTDRAWQPSAFNQQINAIEWGDTIDPDYGVVCMKLCSQWVVQQGSQTALPILKKSLFEKIQIPVPPLALQKQFAQRVAEVRDLEAKQATSRAQLDTLFQSMLHRAFNGEL